MIINKKKKWVAPIMSKIAVIRDTKGGTGTAVENQNNSHAQPSDRKP